MNVMGNVLVIGFPGEGHVNPSLGIVKELMAQGEKVVYYGIEDYAEKIRKSGAEFREYEDFRPSLDMSNRMTKEESYDRYEIMNLFLNESENIITKIMSETKHETYDYVLYDYHLLAGSAVADLLQLPKVSLCTTFALNKELATCMMPSGQTEPDQSSFYPQFEKSLNKFNNQYNTELKDSMDIMSNPGDITLVFTSEFFQPNVSEFTSEYKFIGPSIVKRLDVEDPSYLQNENEKIIFVSMGTIFNQQLEIYNLCVEALKDFEGKVILSIGKNTKTEELAHIPENFVVKQYVPQLEILKRADLFITHGGMNSSSEGLYYDTPLVVIPMAVDQFMVGDRVQKLGAGVKLDKNNVSAELIKNTVNDVLTTHTYKQHAQQIGESLRSAGGYKQGVKEIFKMVPVKA